MACTYDPSPNEIKASNTRARERQMLDKMRKDLDRLTRENDQLREIVIQALDGDTSLDQLPGDLIKLIKADQVKHRKEDLKRLEKTFVRDKDADRLAKVWAADPAEPLAPQLGFDPNDF